MKKLLTLMLLLPTLVFAADAPEKKLKIIELNKANTINFNSKFSSGFVAQKQMEAIRKCLVSPNSEINVVLYTPGGSVSAGKLFFDTLKALPCKFNTITIFSASMGYQTVQNLGNRYILPSGVLMSHRAYVSGLAGEIDGELDQIMSLLKSNINDLDKIAADRVGITLKEYKNLISDELWMTGAQSVEMNHADEVVLAKCDQSLSGTYVDRVETIFGPLYVEFSKCPIITGPLSVRMKRGAKRVTLKQLQDYYSNLTKHTTMDI